MTTILYVCMQNRWSPRARPTFSDRTAYNDNDNDDDDDDDEHTRNGPAGGFMQMP